MLKLLKSGNHAKAENDALQLRADHIISEGNLADSAGGARKERAFAKCSEAPLPHGHGHELVTGSSIKVSSNSRYCDFQVSGTVTMTRTTSNRDLRHRRALAESAL